MEETLCAGVVIATSFAITLESVLGTSAEMWVRMQAEYNLWVVR